MCLSVEGKFERAVCVSSLSLSHSLFEGEARETREERKKKREGKKEGGGKWNERRMMTRESQLEVVLFSLVEKAKRGGENELKEKRDRKRERMRENWEKGSERENEKERRMRRTKLMMVDEERDWREREMR